MVSLDDLKELTLYKKQFFLPIDMKNKKKGSVITLLTPNFESSKLVMTAPYIINHRYFESYYIEKAITKYIKNEVAFDMSNPGEYLYESSTSSREDVIEQVKKSLEDEGLKAHISKDSEWGYNKFIENESETICLGSFNSDTFDKAYKIVSSVLPEGYKAKKDSYFTIFIDNKISSVEENSIVNEAINPTAIDALGRKFSKNIKITFNGYGNELAIVKSFVTHTAIGKAFSRIAVKPPKNLEISVFVADSPDMYNEFTKDSFLIHSPSAFKKMDLDMKYENYVKYIIHLYVIYLLAPNRKADKINDDLAEPAAVYFSGIAADKINSNKVKGFGIEKVYRYVENKYGIHRLISVISSNDILALTKYNLEMNDSDWYKINYRSVNILPKIIREADEEENIPEEKTSDMFDASRITVDNPVPESLEKIKNMGAKLKRSIRRQSVYKLNKIKKDVLRGNVGVDTRAATSLEDLQSGLKDKMTPKTEFAKVSDIDKMTHGDYLVEGDIMYLFEDGSYDSILRQSMYKDRFKNNKEVLEFYNKVKSELPFIKYMYTSKSRYSGRNLFNDVSYYNEIFFKNASKVNEDHSPNSARVFNLYMVLLKRLVNDDMGSAYTKRSIFIPVLDWNHNRGTRMWMYRDDINPISAIYNEAKMHPLNLKNIFGDRDVVFLGAKNYFKINFTKTDMSKSMNVNNFVRLIKRIIDLGYNSPADPDPDGDMETSPKGIAMNIINKVEKSQNVEINNVSKVDTLPSSIDLYSTNKDSIHTDHKAVVKNVVDNPSENIDTMRVGNMKVKDYTNSKMGVERTLPVEVQKKDVSPASIKSDTGTDQSKSVNTTSEEDKKDAVVDRIVAAASNADGEDSAMEKLNDEEFKDMIESLKNDSVDNIRVDKTQASNVIKAQDEFHKKVINGRSVQDMLDNNKTTQDLPSTDLNIASINKDWENLTFMNFDKDYDFNSDIMKMLDSMQHWTYPIAVKNVDIRDNSTSEDIVDLWTIECIDYRKHKFTIKIDIPKFINGSNFLKLRGNEKTLMIQSTLLPIIKTSDDKCQIISSGGYNKIFVSKYGARTGQSMPATSRLIRALNKYSKTNKDIKIEYGDNTKICAKYELPNDYIDLSSVYNTITVGNLKIYFNQDILRSTYEVDDTKGIPVGVESRIDPSTKKGTEYILYYNQDAMRYSNCISSFVAIMLSQYSEGFKELYNKTSISRAKSTYSSAKILNKNIPIIVICCYLEGLLPTLNKAGIKYDFVQKIGRELKFDDTKDFIEYNDGYLVFENNYISAMLMNGLKECDTALYSIKDINNRKMYIDFISKIADNINTDGLENSYDCMLDPITKEILAKFNMPTDYISVLIYASNLLCDNKYVKHIDQSGRRWRRKELIAGYFYKALTTAYGKYANSNRRTRKTSRLDIKQSEVIDLIVSGDPATADLSVNNIVNDVECANTVTNKGLVGLNVARGYTINTRGYDDSMLNLLGMDTGFSGNVGINRQATINANIEGGRGFVKSIDNNTDKLSAANSFTITEAITPLGSTHDDPQRTLMTYVQTSKHMIRCDNNDPTLVTTGADEALPYLVSDIFAYKAKKDGKVVELVQEGFGKKNYMVIEYKDGTHEIVNLSEEVKKNSDGGYFVPMKLDTDLTEGKSFKAGSVLAYDKLSFSNSLGESKNLAANIGTLAKVAIINTDEGFEDSAAITESFANKIGTTVIQGIESKINKGSNVFIYKNIGDHVNEGETLFTYQEDFDEDVANSLLKNLSMDASEISELGRNPVKSKYTGIVSDIVIYRTCDDDSMSQSLKSFVFKYEGKVKSMKNVYKKYGVDSSSLPVTGKVPEVGKTKHLDDAVLIIYYIKYNDNMSVGDKIVFYSANKGIIKYIIPKDKEPYTSFRPNEHIDSFMSLSSISGRMTCSIPLFAATSKLMVELDRSVKDLAGIPYDESEL